MLVSAPFTSMTDAASQAARLRSAVQIAQPAVTRPGPGLGAEWHGTNTLLVMRVSSGVMHVEMEDWQRKVEKMEAEKSNYAEQMAHLKQVRTLIYVLLSEPVMVVAWTLANPWKSAS